MPEFIQRLYCRIWVYASADDGQAVPEYALVIALIALVAIVALQFLGGGMRHVYTVAGNAS